MIISKDLILKTNITLLSGVVLWAFFKWLKKRRLEKNAILEMSPFDYISKDDVNIKVLFGSVTGKSKVFIFIV
jgi:hypothetical protein